MHYCLAVALSAEDYHSVISLLKLLRGKVSEPHGEDQYYFLQRRRRARR